MKRCSFLILAFVTLLALGACSRENATSSAYISLPQDGWAYTDTLQFQMTVPDTVSAGYLNVAIEYSPIYRYRNLWIEVTTSPLKDNPNTVRRDTLEIVMADQEGT